MLRKIIRELTISHFIFIISFILLILFFIREDVVSTFIFMGMSYFSFLYIVIERRNRKTYNNIYYLKYKNH